MNIVFFFKKSSKSLKYDHKPITILLTIPSIFENLILDDAVLQIC